MSSRIKYYIGNFGFSSFRDNSSRFRFLLSGGRNSDEPLTQIDTMTLTVIGDRPSRRFYEMRPTANRLAEASDRLAVCRRYVTAIKDAGTSTGGLCTSRNMSQPEFNEISAATADCWAEFQ